MRTLDDLIRDPCAGCRAPIHVSDERALIAFDFAILAFCPDCADRTLRRQRPPATLLGAVTHPYLVRRRS